MNVDSINYCIKSSCNAIIYNKMIILIMYFMKVNIIEETFFLFTDA
jgi:hypothetical protein